MTIILFSLTLNTRILKSKIPLVKAGYCSNLHTVFNAIKNTEDQPKSAISNSKKFVWWSWPVDSTGYDAHAATGINLLKVPWQSRTRLFNGYFFLSTHHARAIRISI